MADPGHEAIKRIYYERYLPARNRALKEAMGQRFWRRTFDPGWFAVVFSVVCGLVAFGIVGLFT